MNLRLPQNYSSNPRFESGLSILETQMLEEQASSLGRMGAAVERALAVLDASPAAPGSPEHETLLKAAAEAVWHFFIQRDVCGIRDHASIIQHYNIPAAVISRLGVRG
jgi:hypothetical protein